MDSAPEKPKSDLTTEGLDLPRFVIRMIGKMREKMRYMEAGDEEIGTGPKNQMRIFECSHHTGHIFHVHVEKASKLCKKCESPMCHSDHPLDSVEQLLKEHDVYVMGYDNAGIFAVQVPEFCSAKEAHDRVYNSFLEVMRQVWKPKACEVTRQSETKTETQAKTETEPKPVLPSISGLKRRRAEERKKQ